jgi:Spy/CpxP family protein refolding chaperone
MKHKLFAFALGGMLAISANPALYAQDQAPASDAPQQGQWAQGHGHGRMNPDRQLAHMTSRLDLTADQQSQIKPILVARQQKMQALFQDQSVSQQDRRSQMRSIRQNTQAQIEAVLNDQQKQKFEAMHERHGHGGGGDNEPPTSSPQPQ